jgi:hypothetical protein
VNLTNNREQTFPREKTGDRNLQKAKRTLDALRNRVWKEKWPLVTEVVLKSTGPWVLKPYQYHNHTFWPWTTGIEMLARSRFESIEECDLLLSTLTSESNLQMRTFYEWVNPITDERNGAFPFRTGIRLSGFLLWTYSAVLEEGYQMKLENINSLSPLGDNEGERSIYIHDSYLFFY